MMSSCQGTSFKTMRVFTLIVLLTVGLSSVAALPTNQQRIVGGSDATIQQYPYAAGLLYTSNFLTYQHECGGTILNNRAVLTACHCVFGDSTIRWQIRVGSVYANFGGIVSNSNVIITHPNYNVITMDNDVAIVRSATNFIFSTTVRAGSIAGANYNLGDNVALWAIGWGSTTFQGPRSETLRHVQVWSVNQATCRNRYAELEAAVTDNMLCTGWLDVGGRDQCIGDNGSPVIHNNVVVGVRSWGQRCGLARYPGVSARVSRFTAWINANV